MTDRIYSTDQYARETEATILDVRPGDNRVLLDRTVFYPGGGGQPHDTGRLWVGDDSLEVVEVFSEGDRVWHVVDDNIPTIGARVRAVIDWDRRYLLMRTHTAMHALCGVVWERFEAPVTGGGMKPGEGRLDFEIPDWDPDDRAVLEEELNRQLEMDHPIEVGFVSREEAEQDPSLIRTKVSLLPDDLETVRVIDIEGLDRQADGGTHVASTGEVGHVEIVKATSKGKGFRRLRLQLTDVDGSDDGDAGEEAAGEEAAGENAEEGAEEDAAGGDEGG